MLFQQAVDTLLELLQLFESVGIVSLRGGGALAITMHEFCLLYTSSQRARSLYWSQTV